jgi:SAM-dependent methyltransferase
MAAMAHPQPTATVDADVNAALRRYIPIAQHFDFKLVPYFWNINGVTDLTSAVEVSGWALPHGGLDGGTVILVNGAPRGDPVGGELEEVARLYPWWPNARRSQFCLRVEKLEFDIFNTEEVEFRAVPHHAARQHANPYAAMYLRPRDLSEILPDPDLLARIGAENSFHYALFGRTLYRQFENALARVTGKTFADLHTIVDWGCGSGRVARHVIDGLDRDQAFAGFDIDAPAIKWATERIGPWFWVCGKEPPLGIASAHADLVYSYSVFTHLTQAAQQLWIDEIARILAPGGYFLFTILSDTAVLALSPYASLGFLQLLLTAGIHDESENTQLETINVGGDYYRNVWMTAEYINQHWDKLFEILKIERNFHFYQDLVVCRRR